MSLKDLSNEELETMGYDEIAYLVLADAGKKMKLLDLFKKVCKILSLPEETVEQRIGDFFELLSINKKFVLLPKGYWDLATNHLQSIVVEEDEDEQTNDEEIVEEDIEEENEEEDIFYDNDLDDNDDEEDDLKDFVIIEEDENIQ